MSARARRVALGVVGLGVSALFLWLALRKVPLAAAWNRIATVSLGILALSLVTKLVGFGMMTGRTRTLLKPVAPLGVGPVFRSVLLGFAANNVLPARLGDVVRVDYLGRRSGAGFGPCLAVVAFERVVDTFCLVLLLACALPVLLGRVHPGVGLALLVAGALLAMAAAVIVSHHPDAFVRLGRRVAGVLGRAFADRVEPLLARFATGLAAVSSTRSVLAVMAFSLGYWGSSLGSVALWILAFGLQLPWYAPLVVLLFISLGTLLPASPSFVGTYEYFAAAGLKLLGVGATAATSFALVGHVVAVVPFTLVALPVLVPDLMRRRRREASLGEAPG